MPHSPVAFLATVILANVGDVAGKVHPHLFRSGDLNRGAERMPRPSKSLALLRRQDPDVRVDSSRMKYDAAPKSPSPAPQISQWNVHGAVDDAVVPLADLAKTVEGVQPSMPKEFIGGSCKEVCATCTIAATEFPSCKCTANCQLGSDDTICERKASGWLSGFNKHNTPESEWQGVCNHGKIDCATCLDEQAMKDLTECQEEKNPTLCFGKLKAEFTKESQPARWCARKKFKTCERFDHLPQEENGWTCFNAEDKCVASLHPDPKEDIFAYENSFPSRQTPCVWCKLTPPQM